MSISSNGAPEVKSSTGKVTSADWSGSSRGYPNAEDEVGEEYDTYFKEQLGPEKEDFDVDINDFFEYVGMNKDVKFTEKTMREFEEDLDLESNLPKDKIIFVPAKRFSNFNYHYLLETYVPATVDLQGMKLRALDGIEFMFFLSYVNAGSNCLTTDGLQYIEQLTDIIALIVEKNKLDVLKMPKLEQLMFLNVSENEIFKIDPSLSLPALESLIMDNNRVDDIAFLGRRQLPKLRYLSLSNNFIRDVAIPWSRHINTLYLGSNEISDTSGLRGLYKLRTLHLRGNQISNLSLFPTDLVSLEYLNLRANHVSELSTLSVISELPRLKALVLKGNPCMFHGESEENYRIQVLSYLPNLKRLDKSQVTDHEIRKAELLRRTFQGTGEEEEEADDII